MRKSGHCLIVFLMFFVLQQSFAVFKRHRVPAINIPILDKTPIDSAQAVKILSVNPANPKIQYTGRIDFTVAQSPKFWMPGVYIKFKFSGTFCEFAINDLGNNYIEVVIDDTSKQRIKTLSGMGNYTVKNLSEGKHTALICKNTESNVGPMIFLGLRCKKILSLPAKPSRKIEFYGNSITCGTGSDLSIVECGKGKWEDQHNAYMSYGPVVARSLNTQWQLSSYSGIGLIHSCCNIGFTMPDVFDKIALTPSSTAWDFKKYKPDAITICLGQNDGIQDSVTYCNTYIKFIQSLRAKYPDAHIICLNSPMADEKLTKALKNYLTGIVKEMNIMGDNKIHSFFFSRSWNSGCDNHPSLKEHQEIASELEEYLKKTMGW